MNPMDWLDGWKTYIGAAGFLMLAYYEMMNENYAKAGEYLMLAMTAVGLRHAIDKAVKSKK